MKIVGVQAVPIIGGWYCDDKAALESREVEADHYLLRGRPQTPGFNAVREVGGGVGVILTLEGGLTVFGDGTSVTYAGAAGREPPFRFEERAGELGRVIEPWLVGQTVTDFMRLADEAEGLEWMGRRLHPAWRYAVSLALLEGAALAGGRTKAEVLAASFGTRISEEPVRLGVQSGEARHDTVDKAIFHRVDAFPHGLIHDVERDLGPDGETLVDFARWIMIRLHEHGAGPEYRPAIHFDCYGTVGRAFEHDVDRVSGYLARLEEAVSPLTLQIESPVEMKTQASQIEVMAELRASLERRGSRVVMIADEWCNTLGDVRRFAEAGAADMLQVKMPDLGSITQSARAVLECKRWGVAAYLGGSCNETDLSARAAVHLAVATGADQVLARPGMGVDEGVSIMRNEEARLRVLLRHEE